MLLGLLLATSTISLTGQIDISQLQDGRGDWCPRSFRWSCRWRSLRCRSWISRWPSSRRTYAGKWWFLPTSSTCITGCWNAATANAALCMLMYVWSALVSFGVIILGLVQTERQWTVVAVGAVLRAGLDRRHAGPSSARQESSASGESL